MKCKMRVVAVHRYPLTPTDRDIETHYKFACELDHVHSGIGWCWRNKRLLWPTR